MSPLDILLGRTLVLVAHPDDEAVGCGALMQRMDEPIVVFATDGAPRDDYFWKTYGSRFRYSRVRQEEARTALAAVGVSEIEFLPDHASGIEVFVDQELYRAIPQALQRLSALIERRRPRALLTLAYEGGHPDHDTCNFLGAMLGKQYSLATWEMPLYFRAHPGDRIFQDFYASNGSEVEVHPTSEEIAAKHRMLSAYPSQSHFLTQFAENSEHFRPLPVYDYARPPHEGLLNYEAWEWRMTGREVANAFAEYLSSAQVKRA